MAKLRVDIEVIKKGNGFEVVNAQVRDAQKETKKLTSDTGKLALGVAAVAAAYASIDIVGGLIRRGVEFNSVLEQSKLGIAGILTSFGEIEDAQGRKVEGEEKWHAAMYISQQMQDKLKIAAAKTAAEYKDLVNVLQVAVGPALQAAMSPDEIVEFTTLVTQASQALGLKTMQVSQEIRALFEGRVDPNSQVAQVMFSNLPVKNAKAYIEELKRTGKFMEFMRKSLAGFSRAGDEFGKTLEGSWSNFNDILDITLGTLTGPLAARLTEINVELTSMLDENSESGMKLRDAMAAVIEIVSILIDAFVQLLKWMPQIVGGFTAAAAAIRTTFYAAAEMAVRGIQLVLTAVDRLSEVISRIAEKAMSVSDSVSGSTFFDIFTPGLGKDMTKMAYTLGAFATGLEVVGDKAGSTATSMNDLRAGLADLKDNAALDFADRFNMMLGKTSMLSSETSEALKNLFNFTKKPDAPGDGDGKETPAEKAAKALTESITKLAGETDEYIRARKAAAEDLSFETALAREDDAIQKIIMTRERELELLEARREEFERSATAIMAQYAGATPAQIAAVEAMIRDRRVALEEELAAARINIETDASLSIEEENQRILDRVFDRKVRLIDKATEHELRNLERVKLVLGDMMSVLGDGFRDTLYDLSRGGNELEDIFRSITDQMKAIWVDALGTMLDDYLSMWKAIATGDSDEMDRLGIDQSKLGPNASRNAKLGMGMVQGAGALYGIYDQSQGMSKGQAALSGAMSGAMAGAQIGSLFAWAGGTFWGAIIGAFVGGIAGFLSGGTDEKAFGVTVGSDGKLKISIAGGDTKQREVDQAQRDLNETILSVRSNMLDIFTLLPTSVLEALSSITIDENWGSKEFQKKFGSSKTAVDALKDFINVKVPQMLLADYFGTGTLLNEDEMRKKYEEQFGPAPKPSDYRDDFTPRKPGEDFEPPGEEWRAAMDAWEKGFADFAANAGGVFEYDGPLGQALNLLGVSTNRISELKDLMMSVDFGEAQKILGEYIQNLVAFMELSDFMAMTMEEKIAHAKGQLEKTPLDIIKDLDSRLSVLSSGFGDMGLEEQIQTATKLRDLTQQRYELEMQYILQITRIMEQITDSIDRQIFDIEQTQRNEPEQIDALLARQRDLRTRLQEAKTPEEIQQIVSEMQQNANALYEMMGKTPEAAQQMIDMLNDIKELSRDRLTALLDDLEAQNAKTRGLIDEILIYLRDGIKAVVDGDGVEKVDLDEDGNPVDPTPTDPDEEDVDVFATATGTFSDAARTFADAVASSSQTQIIVQPVVNVTVSGDAASLLDNLQVVITQAAVQRAMIRMTEVMMKNKEL